MAEGFCTVDDVRLVFQDSELSGALAEDTNQLVVDTIDAVSDTVEKATKRFWYDSGGISGDDENVVASSAKSRDDEHDIPSHAGEVIGAAEPTGISPESRTVFSTGPGTSDIKERIQTYTGDLDDDTIPTYTRITLARKDVDSLDKLQVLNENGSLKDWVASNDYDTSVGLSNRGDDAWVRENNGGVSELNIDVHSLDDDIPALPNAVYVEVTYGIDGIPKRVRRGVASLVAADLILDDEFVTAIPDNGQLVNLETKADRWGRTGVQKLQQDIVDDTLLEPYQ